MNLFLLFLFLVCGESSASKTRLSISSGSVGSLGLSIGIGDDDLGLIVGEDNMEPVNDTFATINLFLLLVFLVPGESLESNIKSSSDSSVCFVLLSSADSVISVTADMLELSNDKPGPVRILYSFWLAMQSTPYKFVRFLITLALRCMVPLATPL